MTKAAITTVGEGEHKHDVPVKEFIGQDAAVLARAAGRNVSSDVELLFAETDESNPFVPVEQMMPFVPFVRGATLTMPSRWRCGASMVSVTRRSSTRTTSRI